MDCKPSACAVAVQCVNLCWCLGCGQWIVGNAHCPDVNSCLPLSKGKEQLAILVQDGHPRQDLNRSTLKVLNKGHAPTIESNADIHGAMGLPQNIVAMAPICMGIVIHHAPLMSSDRLFWRRNCAVNVQTAPIADPFIISPDAGRHVLGHIACATGLRIHHIRLAAVSPPVPKVIIDEHIFSMELCSGIGAKYNRREPIVCSVIVDESERVITQLI